MILPKLVIFIAILEVGPLLAETETEEREEVAKALLSIPTLIAQEKFRDTELALQKVIPYQIKLRGAEDVRTLVSKQLLSDAVTGQGRLIESEALMTDVVKILEDKYGKQHLQTVAAKMRLANIKAEIGKVNEAHNIYNNILNIEPWPSELDTFVLMIKLKLSDLLRQEGKLADAKTMSDWVEKKLEIGFGKKNAATRNALSVKASIEYDMGDFERALADFEFVWNECKATLGNTHSLTISSAQKMAMARAADGQLQDAIPLIRSTLDSATAKLGSEHPITLEGDLVYAKMLFEKRSLDDAGEKAKEAANIGKRKYGPLFPASLQAEFLLARIQFSKGQGQLARATAIDSMINLTRAVGGASPIITKLRQDMKGILESAESK